MVRSVAAYHFKPGQRDVGRLTIILQFRLIVPRGRRLAHAVHLRCKHTPHEVARLRPTAIQIDRADYRFQAIRQQGDPFPAASGFFTLAQTHQGRQFHTPGYPAHCIPIYHGGS